MRDFHPARQKGSAIIRHILPAAFAVVIGAFQVSSALAAPTFSTIYSFSGPDGSNPNGKLLPGASGVFYGTTFYGGADGKGTVFQLTAGAGGTFTESVIWNFGPGKLGAHPAAGLVMDANGALYGTASTSDGQRTGTVFQLVPPVAPSTAWTYKVLHEFGTSPDGAFPNSDLTMGPQGTLYGTTVTGGTGSGTVFALVPPTTTGGPWTEEVIYTFSGLTDGSAPFGPVVFDSAGALFGTCTAGGSSAAGTVFQLVKPTTGTIWTEKTLYDFKGGADGSHPLAGVLVGSKGVIFGTTYVGGASNAGVIFQLTPKAGAAGCLHRNGPSRV